ncbi:MULTISPECIES: exodeoxyribonuclease VII large subunit [Campylobacter]|uniref:exodeoxyribonuclease VII large subunit n=1 Tax=Campylobacter TaxID=194 RepID=UPI000A336584|nr:MULTISPECIES: exodeoxyribonuclease VII large subunit [unclassified Campylobacter]MCR8678861.1 exodeoxyribonuclease VII large subunit [Campylobacter sp. RM19072]MCR8695942.1 exodeoxyribonuclease VII large subunit [Campylobacter sp. RM19073]
MTVSDLNESAKALLESHFNSIEVQGEISRLTKHSSGHWYFTLKDEKSAISVVIYKFSNQNIKFDIKDGMEVTLIGKLSIYSPNGSYQFIANRIMPIGVGELELAFNQLKERLSPLFDPAHKKQLPKYPNRVGIITSASSAAFADMQRVISNRYILPKFYLFNSLVQGNKAADNIIKMLNIADNMNLDAIVIARGGGSREDLWCFNDEKLAYAIYEAKTPIISAIGHEIDCSISDFVADHRSLTPTAAMVDLLPDSNELYQKFDIIQNSLISLISAKFSRYEGFLNLSKAQIKSKAIEQKLNLATLTLDKFKSNLDNFLYKKLNLAQSKIEKFELILKKQEHFYKVTKNMAQIVKDSKIVSLSKLKSKDEITIISQDLYKEAIIK